MSLLFVFVVAEDGSPREPLLTVVDKLLFLNSV